MQSEVDYLLFSAIKTIKTMKGIALLIDEQIPECIHALGRSLFENYMDLNKINCDPSFFKMKLLPKVDKAVLFDELGAGTDPTEGAALAIAILSTLHERGIQIGRAHV